MISTGGCKKISLIKAKNLIYFCTGCPKRALRGIKIGFFFQRCIRNKKFGSQEFLGMGCLKFLLVKGKKPQGGGVQRPQAF